MVGTSVESRISTYGTEAISVRENSGKNPFANVFVTAWENYANVIVEQFSKCCWSSEKAKSSGDTVLHRKNTKKREDSLPNGLSSRICSNLNFKILILTKDSESD